MFGKYSTRLILTLFSLLLISCSEHPKLNALPADATIVAFGDSLTYGIGADQTASYPRVLAGLTGLEVVNAGVSGETTGEGIKRFKAVLAQYQPKLVILLEGGNDILRNQDLSQTKLNLATMIEIAQAQRIQVILIGVPEKKLFSNSAPFYTELAMEFNLPFDDETLSNLLRSAKYKSDSVHLNAAGYRQLADNIYSMIKDNGAL